MPEFYMMFARKCPIFSWHLPPKIFFDFFFFFFGGGVRAPTFVFYAYGHTLTSTRTETVEKTLLPPGSSQNEWSLDFIGVQDLLSMKVIMIMIVFWSINVADLYWRPLLTLSHRLAYSRSRSAWSKGGHWAATWRCCASIAWTGWTLAMTKLWCQSHKDCARYSSVRASVNDDFVPRTSRTINDKAASVAAWNGLPTELKLLRCTSTFRRKLAVGGKRKKHSECKLLPAAIEFCRNAYFVPKLLVSDCQIWWITDYNVSHPPPEIFWHFSQTVGNF